MIGICETNCQICNNYKNNICEGCKKTKGCPFGKKCWIAKYIEIAGIDNFNKLKQELINEFNTLNIEGMAKIETLYSLNGSLVNLEYKLPNGKKTKFLDDNEIYLGNQIESVYNNNEIKKYYGLVANTTFLLICEYEKDGINPEIIIYKKR